MKTSQVVFVSVGLNVKVWRTVSVKRSLLPLPFASHKDIPVQKKNTEWPVCLIRHCIPQSLEQASLKWEGLFIHVSKQLLFKSFIDRHVVDIQLQILKKYGLHLPVKPSSISRQRTYPSPLKISLRIFLISPFCSFAHCTIPKQQRSDYYYYKLVCIF